MSADRPTIGSAEAPEAVYYLADYQCPHCKRFEEGGGLDRIRERLVESGRARIEFVNFPVLGDDSVTAAEASRFVWDHAPDTFWEWHRAVFVAQGAENDGWANAKNLTRVSARLVDERALAGALERRDYGDAVRRDVEFARERGARATPTLVVRDEAVVAVDRERVDRAVERAVARAA